MRIFYFVLILFTGSLALAARPVVGTLQRDDKGLSLITDTGCQKYRISTKSEDAEFNLYKLQSGDYITATGLLDENTCEAVIESIDFVGLKKLLGYWHSSAGLFSIPSFSYLTFYPNDKTDISNEAPEIFDPVSPVNFKYSVTPSEGKDWVVFLSDKNSTVFATIRFSKTRATMKFYDSETGKITRTLYLSKWGTLK